MFGQRLAAVIEIMNVSPLSLPARQQSIV